MVYVVDATGKVLHFCKADGYECGPRGGWTRIKQGEQFTGRVFDAIYVGFTHPNQVTQATSMQSAQSIERLLAMAAEVIDLRPTCAAQALHRIKRSLANFDTRSKEWR